MQHQRGEKKNHTGSEHTRIKLAYILSGRTVRAPPPPPPPPPSLLPSLRDNCTSRNRTSASARLACLPVFFLFFFENHCDDNLGWIWSSSVVFSKSLYFFTKSRLLESFFFIKEMTVFFLEKKKFIESQVGLNIMIYFQYFFFWDFLYFMF